MNAMSATVLPRTIWVLTEGAAGMVNQCLALTDALGVEPIIKRARPAGFWAYVPPWLALPSPRHLEVGSDALAPPFPELLIACGRKSIGLGLALRRASGRRCFVVCVQDPRLNPSRFDLVVAPRHDAVRGSNVILTHGAPSRVTPTRLDAAKTQFAARFAHLPRPLVSVLLGGRTKHHRFAPVEAEALGRQLAALARQENAGLAITASRRTPPESLAAFRAGLGHTPAYFYDGTAENPYFGLLAHADAIVVTADSVNMISDACSTGRPVLVAALHGRTSARFERFLAQMRAGGLIRRFEGRLEHYAYTPLTDATEAAAEIRRRLAAFASH